MAKPLRIVASGLLFWATYVIVALALMWTAVVRQTPGPDQAAYRSRDMGLGASWMIPMSIVGVLGYVLTLIAVNRVRRMTGGAPLTDWWIPPASALGAIGLDYTFVPPFLARITDAVIGPESMWLIVTVPLGVVVLATVGCALAATILGRKRNVSESAAAAG